MGRTGAQKLPTERSGWRHTQRRNNGKARLERTAGPCLRRRRDPTTARNRATGKQRRRRHAHNGGAGVFGGCDGESRCVSKVRYSWTGRRVCSVRVGRTCPCGRMRDSGRYGGGEIHRPVCSCDGGYCRGEVFVLRCSPATLLQLSGPGRRPPTDGRECACGAGELSNKENRTQEAKYRRPGGLLDEEDGGIP